MPRTVDSWVARSVSRYRSWCLLWQRWGTAWAGARGLGDTSVERHSYILGCLKRSYASPTLTTCICTTDNGWYRGSGGLIGANDGTLSPVLATYARPWPAPFGVTRAAWKTLQTGESALRKSTTSPSRRSPPSFPRYIRSPDRCEEGCTTSTRALRAGWGTDHLAPSGHRAATNGAYPVRYGIERTYSLTRG